MKTYNTNLASEFHILSMLHRLGFDASLTLGNKKSVDIVVVRDSGDVATIDVKGLAGTTSWPVDNVKKIAKDHFLVFVSPSSAKWTITRYPPRCTLSPPSVSHCLCTTRPTGNDTSCSCPGCESTEWSSETHGIC